MRTLWAVLTFGSALSLQAESATDSTELRSSLSRDQTNFRYISSSIYVVDQGHLRYLRFGSAEGTDQSVLDLVNPNRLAMPYLRPAALAAEFVADAKCILIVGLGGGGFTRYLRQRFPEATIKAVEIDKEVVSVARQFFKIEQDPRLIIHLGDGAEFLERMPKIPGGRFDLIFLDAYDGARIPEPLTTEKFLTNVYRQLRERGLVIANVGIDDLEAYKSRFESIVPSCARLRTWENENTILVGSKFALPYREELVNRAHILDAKREREFMFVTIARTWSPCREQVDATWD